MPDNMNFNQDNGGAMTAITASYSMVPRNAEAQIAQAKQMIALNTKLLKEILEEGTDYDRIPGTDRPTLLKAGAEMLCRVYGLAQGDQRVTDKTEDWERGIFCYTVTCPLVHIESGRVVSVGIGTANSQEVKYKYVTAKDANNKKIYENGKPVKIENPDAADNINTLIKMASKRALVDATLKATCASRLFTQDMEDRKGFAAAQGAIEKASGAQLGLIRKLANDDINRVRALLGANGANLTNFDDILRNDASKLIDALKAQTNNGGGNSGNNSGNNGGSYGGGYDPYGDDPGAFAPPPPPQNNGYNQAPPQQQGGELVCADCGATITSAEQSYSSKKFGRALCRKCQAAAKS